MVTLSCLSTLQSLAVFNSYHNPLSVSHHVFCSTSGQWDEAVRVYNSTPLQELSDLSGLALAYCRAGLVPESINGEGWRCSEILVVYLLARVTVNDLLCVCVQPMNVPWLWLPVTRRRLWS